MKKYLTFIIAGALAGASFSAWSVQPLTDSNVRRGRSLSAGQATLMTFRTSWPKKRVRKGLKASW